MKLTARQWRDVADLCATAALGVHLGASKHDNRARTRAGQWIQALAAKASKNARQAESEERAK